MRKKKADEINLSGHSLDNSSTPKEEIENTIEVITDNFLRTKHLTTIQLQFTILYDDLDLDRGAKPFREVIGDLFKDVELADPEPRALWLVFDPTELKHVLREMRKHDRKLFDNLDTHASVALIDGTSKYLKLLSDTVVLGPDPKRRQTLTAFPTDGGYKYFAHFKPSAKEGWKRGPLCMALYDVPGQLDNLLKSLHEAHDERISGSEKTKVKNLKKLSISLVSLEDLIA